MSTETNHASQVRTYRGRTLEELIPKIRAELGPDAIILREREGRTGGLNGFFAQRCVEVDAQAGPTVDLYDDDQAAMPTGQAQAASAAGEPSDPTAGANPGADSGTGGDPGADSGTGGDPAGAGAADDSPATPGPAAPAGGPAQAGGPAVPDDTLTGGPAQVGGPAPASEELSFAERLDRVRRTREDPAPGAIVPEPPAPAASAPEPLAPAPSAPEPPASAPEPAASAPEPPASAPEPPAPATTPPPLRTLSGPAAVAPDPAAEAVARELTGHGISEAWARELIASAATHLSPFVPGASLRDAVRAALAAGVTAAPLLPSAGAAVAFVGAGGAGKTRCAAALASAYARASTLPVTVVSLTDEARGSDIAAILSGSGVPVHAAHGEAAAETIARSRRGGLVVVDTGATSPVDERGVALLAAQLSDLQLDAVYLTVPATLSMSAGRALVDGLAPLGPTAVVITHADETDELGIPTELAHLSGLPIAFIHDGLLPAALAVADPARVVAGVLP